MLPLVLLGAAAFWLAHHYSSKKRITGVTIGPVEIQRAEGNPMLMSPAQYRAALSLRRRAGYEVSGLGGFNLASLVQSVDWNKAQGLAQRYGPLVASYYPPAGIALAALNKMQKKAQAGDPQAIATMARLASAAQSGDPGAQKMVKGLATVSTVRDHVDAAQAEQEEGQE